MKSNFDIIVIGSGAGGLVVAIGAAKAGKKVLLIEKGAYGGDCTNYGCIPSKSLIAAAKNIHYANFTKEQALNHSSKVFHEVREIITRIRKHEEPAALNKWLFIQSLLAKWIGVLHQDALKDL